MALPGAAAGATWDNFQCWSEYGGTYGDREVRGCGPFYPGEVQ